MLLLLILLQDQHLLVHSNSARMSWFQTIITSLLSLFLSPVLIHSFIIWSMPGTLSLIKDAEICWMYLRCSRSVGTRQKGNNYILLLWRFKIWECLQRSGSQDFLCPEHDWCLRLTPSVPWLTQMAKNLRSTFDSSLITGCPCGCEHPGLGHTFPSPACPNSLRISQGKDAVGMPYKRRRVLNGDDAWRGFI